MTALLPFSRPIRPLLFPLRALWNFIFLFYFVQGPWLQYCFAILMKSLLLFSITLLFLTPYLPAQQPTGRLQIGFNKNILQTGESLQVRVDYLVDSSQTTLPSLSTLELIIQHEEGFRSRLRWPVINGQASGTLYLPDSLPLGKYTLLAGLQQRFFEVLGEIKGGSSRSLQAMLLTKEGDWDEQEISVSSDGTFAIRNWLFEDNALLAFSPMESKQPLDIRIRTQLDSSYTPLAVAGRTFYLGTPSTAARAALDQPVEASVALFEDGRTTLPAVVVRATTKTSAQQFDEAHASGLFQSANERLLSVMDDRAALGHTNVFSYLQGRVAGLQIAPAGFSGGAARWRGRGVTFFVDEMRVPAQQVAALPMTDIAIIKAYPPPFMGAPGGGGAIAIYTRRGDEASFLPAGRQVFKVRGYTPSATTLDLGKLSL